MNSGQLVKLTRLSLLIAKFVANTTLKKNSLSDPQERQNFFIQNCSIYSHQFLKILNCQVKVNGLDEALLKNKNYLFVCNHMSFLEVLGLAAFVPSIFVTSVDMGETKFIGTLAELSGSIFVERRSRQKIERDVKKISKVLKDGYNVVIYPEGTTADGAAVMPFKKSLFHSALEAQKNIWPVCVKYLEYDQQLFSQKNRDKMCWHGEVTFMQLVLGLLASRGTTIELNFLKPIPVTPESQRRDVADQAYKVISDCYGHPLEDKVL
jgi:1-acyl-sn-glycerol-3-phosphate acyltransferase